MTLFGTDGIRGPANRPPLDPTTLLELGSVLGDLLRPSREESAGVLLADDGRLSGEMIRTALTAGLLSRGLDTADGGLMTTPALAHETRLGNFAAGIMISASHNQAEDNGIKIFGGDGQKIPDPVEQRIEQAMRVRPTERGYERPGRARRLALGASAYRDFLRQVFKHLDLDGIDIVVDCANGGGSHLVPEVLAELRARVHARNAYPDGTNINRGCGALHPDGVAAQVTDQGCHLGLCIDGDGDRAVFIDEKGAVVHGDALLTMLAIQLSEREALTEGGVAVTVMSNLGLKKTLAARDIRVVETPVGDRSVMAAMRAEGLQLGGENSGHVIFGAEHHYAGDGLYTCLKVLTLMRETGRPLSDLAACFQPYPQQLVNVEVTAKPPLDSLPAVVAAKEDVEARLGADGRVVLRYSGTENLCRVMVEAETEQLVHEMVATLVTAVRASLGV